MTTETQEIIRAWVIGSEGTEVYVAHSEEEMRRYYIEMVGAEEAADDLANHFTEIAQDRMNVEHNFREENPDTGEYDTVVTTYRKLATDGEIPGQILSAYN